MMKILLKTQAELNAAGRCDIDYHLPSVHLADFPRDIILSIDAVAMVLKEKRNPREKEDELFQYVSISSVDVSIGRIANPEEVLGIDAPSRARKVIREGDILISTCRPTRGAIAVVPKYLDNEICSTAFSVVRAKQGKVLPQYLHWALRLPSTLEQFRKWSTGSSYPAILDEDVEKTLIPVPSLELQKQIVSDIAAGLKQRDEVMRRTEEDWQLIQKTSKMRLTGSEPQGEAHSTHRDREFDIQLEMSRSAPSK